MSFGQIFRKLKIHRKDVRSPARGGETETALTCSLTWAACGRIILSGMVISLNVLLLQNRKLSPSLGEGADIKTWTQKKKSVQ